MKARVTIIAVVAAILGAVALGAWYLHGRAVPVLDPKGVVGRQELQLLILAVVLAVVVVVPVFALTIAIAWKYRATNPKARYRPEWDHSRAAETVWWGVPLALITVLSVVTWIGTHQLDPAKPLASRKPAMTIQVVALDWKWLFIYPDQHIATVNFVQFPVDTPVHFVITSDAPMNSFWIPQLGGQIYAMNGMSTQLQLMADTRGDYAGSSANLSGAGFAGMKFTARASSQADFDEWVQTVQASTQSLTKGSYESLAKPSQNDAVTYYASSPSGLYDNIMAKYMMPVASSSDSMMPGMVMP